MLYCHCGENEIPDVDLISQGSRDSCIHDPINLIEIHKDLTADTSVYLTDTGTNNDNVFSFQFSLAKVHSGHCLHFCLCHFCAKFLNFYFHCSDNTKHLNSSVL